MIPIWIPAVQCAQAHTETKYKTPDMTPKLFTFTESF